MLGLVALLVTMTLGHLTCGPPVYWAEPVHGFVIEAGTKQPLAGAVVLAEWILFQPAFGHGYTNGRLHISGSVTDARGAFALDAWGPKLRPPFAYIAELAPRLTVFKHGYEPELASNSRSEGDALLVSDWDGKTISLEPYRGDSKERAMQLTVLLPDNLDDDELPSVNPLFEEIDKEREFLGSAGINLLAYISHLRNRK